MQNEITAKNWLHLQELLFEESWNSEIGRHRLSFVFRGGSVYDHPLITGLKRVCDGHEHLELSLLRNFRKYSADSFTSDPSIWEVVSLGQHHGLPTRMLDWTYSPYVALHFATAKLNEYDKDGVIWCIDVSKTNKMMPERFKAALKNEDAYSFTTSILAKHIETFSDMKKPEEDDYVLFFEPPSISARIVNQYALFSVFSDPKALISDWLTEYPDIYKKIRIPAELKWEVRDKLDQCNITERVIFPGMDGLCKWLSRHYSSHKVE